MEQSQHIRLDVYIKSNCWNCEETERILDDIGSEFPAVRIRRLDLSQPSTPKEIFATPTYVLNDRILCLGNPSRNQLREELVSARQMGCAE